MIAHQTSEPGGDCYVALELSRSKWLIGALLPGQEKIKTTTVAGGDTAALLQALNDIVVQCVSARLGSFYDGEAFN